MKLDGCGAVCSSDLGSAFSNRSNLGASGKVAEAAPRANGPGSSSVDGPRSISW